MEYLEKIRRSFCRYLDYESRERDILNSTLERLAENLDETIIFGGMIREFALGNTRDFSSDIDIVTMSNRSEIFAAIKNYSPKLNKFGGFRFLVGTQLFDIWSFEDTWAFRKGLVRGDSFDDLFKTTFFNIDAAGFDLKTRKPLLSEIYLEALRTRTLDLNLIANPAPAAMAKRAVKLALENNLAVSHDLLTYILENSEPICHSEYSRFLDSVESLNSKFYFDKFRFWYQQSLFSECDLSSQASISSKAIEKQCLNNYKNIEHWAYKPCLSEESNVFSTCFQRVNG